MFLAFISRLINIALSRANHVFSLGPVQLIWKSLSRLCAKRKLLALYDVHAPVRSILNRAYYRAWPPLILARSCRS